MASSQGGSEQYLQLIQQLIELSYHISEESTGLAVSYTIWTKNYLLLKLVFQNSVQDTLRRSILSHLV